MQGLAVFLSGPGRHVLYFDDFEVEGELSADYLERHDEALTHLSQRRAAEIQARADRVVGHFFRATQLYRAGQRSGPELHGWLAEYQRRLRTYIEQELEAVTSALPQVRAQPPATKELRTLEGKVRPLLYAVQSWRALPYAAGSLAAVFGHTPPYLTFVVPSIQNLPLLSDSFPMPGTVGTELNVRACRGEFEPTSVAILSSVALDHVLLKPTELTCGAYTIPAPAVDIRLVKVWWRRGQRVSQEGFKYKDVLCPELLLHDDSFVTAVGDADEPRNQLKDTNAPRDAPTLQPCSIPAGTAREFWITVHVPQTAPAGRYQGRIIISARNQPDLPLSLTVEVLPFDLAENRWEYSIFYRAGRLADQPSIGSEAKSPQQYEAEILNMKQHGVEMPSTYIGFSRQPDGSFDFSKLERAMEIRKQLGVTRGPIPLLVGCGGISFYRFVHETDPAKRETMLKQAAESTKALREFCRRGGYPQMLVYAIDEAGTDVLAAERLLMQTIAEAGGGICVGCGAGFFGATGKYLTRPIVHIASPAEYPLVHQAGNKVWIYGRPQTDGRGCPETYRRSYGLRLFKNGEDGVCPYAYQHTFGEDIYDDFDGEYYADHVVAFPTIDGVVDTTHWEGFREAADDTRYLTTLLEAIEQAPARKAATAVTAQQWLQALDINQDLDEIRRRMIRYILLLSTG